MPGRRRLLAVGVSVGLHLAFLLALGVVWIRAQHRAAAASASMAPRPGPASMRVTLLGGRVAAPPSTTDPRPPPAHAKSRLPGVAPESPSEGAHRGTPAPSPPPGPGEPGGRAAAASPGGVAPGGALPPAPDPLLATLQARIAAAARTCYPASAARFRLRGQVPLSFCLGPTGAPEKLLLQGTTGSPLLDAAARDCVVPSAAPLPPRPGCYTVLVEFREP